jgi:hypothetical protein
MAEDTLKYIAVISIALIAIMYGNSQVTEIVPKQVAYQEPYQVPYQESYQDPIYTPYVSGSITTGVIMLGATLTFTNYVSIDIGENTGSQYSPKYTVTLCKKKSDCIIYDDVSSYSYKTNNVITGYNTAYRTSYQTLYKTAYRTENTPITKTRFEWLFN